MKAILLIVVALSVANCWSLPKVSLPKVSLPKISLPKIDFPSVPNMIPKLVVKHEDVAVKVAIAKL